jgi:hypothetical protein
MEKMKKLSAAQHVLCLLFSLEFGSFKTCVAYIPTASL